jgi:hypothetical protein
MARAVESHAGPGSAGTAYCAPPWPSPARPGVEALSMRKLTEDLGVVLMVIYKHVASKGSMTNALILSGKCGRSPPRAPMHKHNGQQLARWTITGAANHGRPGR